MAGTLEMRPSLPNQQSLLYRDYESLPLEQVILPEEVTQKLVDRYNSKKPLEQAIKLAQRLDKEGEIEKLLDIASIQAELAEYPSLKSIVSLLNTTYQRNGLNWAQASRIAAYMGDTEEAFQFAQNASRGKDTWPFISTADVLVVRGLDANPFLDKADEVARRQTYKNFPGLKVAQYAELAVGMHRHHRDPHPWLEMAQEILYTVDTDDLWAYANLSHGYAGIGNFDKAKSLVNKIIDGPEEKTQKERLGVTASIARQQFEQGFTEAALQAVREPQYSATFSDLLFKKAYLSAKVGQDPREVLSEALNLVKQTKKVPGIDPPYKIAIAHSTAARIQAIAGKDPDEMFKIALEQTASMEYEDDQSETYKQIARDMFATGQDVHEILDAALKAESDKQDPGMLGDALQAALDCGYYEYITPITERLLRYETIYDRPNYASESWRKVIHDWRIVFLIKEARSLSQNSSAKTQMIARAGTYGYI